MPGRGPNKIKLGNATLDASSGPIKVSDSGGTYGPVIHAPASSTVTVGSGKDFSAPQAAYDSLIGQVVQSALTINVDAGTYAEALIFANHPNADLITIQGDTRTYAGTHFATTGSITYNGGTSYTITISGNTSTGIVATDNIIIGGMATASHNGRFAVTSVTTGSGNTLVTYTNASGPAASETVRTLTRVVLCPNRIIDGTGSSWAIDVQTRGLTITGFDLTGDGSTGGIAVSNGAKLTCSKISAYARLTGYSATKSGTIIASASVTALGGARGFSAESSGYIEATGSYAANNSSANYYATLDGYIKADSSKATGTVGTQYGYHATGGIISAVSATASYLSNGYFATNGGKLLASSADATYCSIGFYSDLNGWMYAGSSTASNNSQNYNPPINAHINSTGGQITAGAPSTLPTLYVGASRAYTTIQGAWDALLGTRPAENITVAVDAGTYTESLVFANQPFASRITIQGDTRTYAGKHWATTGNITYSGGSCTITVVGTEPQDSTNGVKNGDYILVGGPNDSKNMGRFLVTNVANNSGNTDITYTNGNSPPASEAVLAYTRVILCPNRIIAGNGADCVTSKCSDPVNIKGFTLLITGAKVGIYAMDGGKIRPGQISCYGAAAGRGFFANNNSNIFSLDDFCSAVNCQYGFQVANGSYVRVDGSYVANCTVSGYACAYNSTLIAGYDHVLYLPHSCIATKCGYGFLVNLRGYINCGYARATYNTNGFYAAWAACIYCPGYYATGNGANFNPSAAGDVGSYYGNWNSLIVYA
jgi:hypothetical protein